MTRKDSEQGMGKQAPVTFFCSRCGACCRQLELFGEMYRWLDGGGGVCRYLDLESNLCTIYEIRPLICRVVEGYHLFFFDRPFDEYVRDTRLACSMLQEMLDKKKVEDAL